MILFVLILMLVNISGAQDVLTVRQVSVQQGKSIIIPCWYNSVYVHHVKCLSVKQFWGSSRCVVSSDGRVKHQTFSVWEDKTINILTVEMRNVLKSQAGTYWCGIEISGRDVKERLNLKVTTGYSELYVENQRFTGFEAGSVTISCHHHVIRNMDGKWCKLGGGCIHGTFGTLNGAFVNIIYSSELMVVTMSNLKKENTGWYWCSMKEHQMPVHITVFRRRETITSTTRIETTSEQPTTVQLFTGRIVHFTPSQNLHETPSLLWQIILGINLVLIVILSCFAVYLCKRDKNLPTNTSQREQQSDTESEGTCLTMGERQAEQATAGDSEVIYTTVEFIKLQTPQ